METENSRFAREKLAEWHRNHQQLGLFLAVGGGTYCSMRVHVTSAAKHMAALRGEAGTMALWINDARFEYGPVDLFLTPTPPGKQVTGLSIYLKKGAWVFLFELNEKEHSWFGLDAEGARNFLLTEDEEDDEMAGVLG